MRPRGTLPHAARRGADAGLHARWHAGHGERTLGRRPRKRPARTVLLANAYHLLLRPGLEVFERLGGIHRFMQWGGSVLTDSGGFQVFSLAERPTRSPRTGAVFRSYVDGDAHPAEPRAQHRGAACDRQRHHDGDGSVHPVDRGSRDRGRGDAPHASAGPNAASRRAATRPRRSSASCRAPASRISAGRAPKP